MHHFMWRATTLVLVVMAAFALSANAQAPSNTSSTANKSQPIVQPNVGATKAPQPGTVQPGATQRARAAQKQAVPNTQPPMNRDTVRQRDLLNQSRSQVQPAVPNTQGQLRTGVRDGSIQTDQGNLTDRAALQNQQFLRQRTVLRPTVTRSPDIGLWFNPTVRDRLVISDVTPIGPFTRLGFREGDRIVSVDGHSVVTERQFVDSLLTGSVDPVQVVVFRNGLNHTIAVDPTILAQQQSFIPEVAPLEQFGVVLDDRFNDRIVVWRVFPGTPAFFAGFRPGDVITTLSGQPFRTRLEFENAIVGLPAGEIPVRVLRGDRPRDLVVDVPQFQRTAQRPVIQPREEVGRARLQRQAESIQRRGSNPAIDQGPANHTAPTLPDVPRSERR